MPRRINYRSVSKHRNYTVADIATCLAVCRGTVRRWIKDDLPALHDCKPMLVLGEDLIAFLKARRKPRQKCSLGECYCFACRAPRQAAGGVAEVRWDTPSTGNLRALCVVCNTIMHKRISAEHLSEVQVILDVSVVQAFKPISNSLPACSNDHFGMVDEDHA